MRKLASTVLAVTACVALLAAAKAENNYPIKPIRLLVGSEPGGTTDLVARIISKTMSGILGVAVVVENRPGANQTIAAELTARAAPDGYTLYMVPAGFGINPALYKTLPYDSLKDFTPIGEVALAPNVLVINPSVPARSVPELIALARAKPGSLSYGSSGVGAPSHLAGALFALLTNTDMVHVAYKGSGPAMTDLLGGTIQLSFPSIPGALPFVTSNQLVALGVTTRVRSSMLKLIPTIEEAGVPGYDVGSWFGISGPAGLPAPVVTRLNGAINDALKNPDLLDLLARQGAEPVGGPPQQFAATITDDIKKWTEAFKTLKINSQ